MVKRVQHVRHDTAGADAYTGLEGEITGDTTTNELRLHDGLTAGGHAIARADLANIDIAKLFLDTTELVVNDGGSSTFDFRVETNTIAQALFIDASAETAAFGVPVTFNDAVTFAGSVSMSGLSLGASLVFEGATADDYETTLAVVDPTVDRTFTLPDADITVASYANTYLSTTTELAFQQAVNLEIDIDVMGYDATMLVDADIGGSVQGYNADTLFADITDVLSVGYTTGSFDLGNLNSATTLTIGDRHIQHATMTGSFTLTAPDDVDEGAMVLEFTIDGTGGYTLTLSGFNEPSGTADMNAGVVNYFKIVKQNTNTTIEIIQAA